MQMLHGDFGDDEKACWVSEMMAEVGYATGLHWGCDPAAAGAILREVQVWPNATLLSLAVFVTHRTSAAGAA